MRFEIHVCTSCADPDVGRRRTGDGGGPALLSAIRDALARRPFAAQADLYDFECLGACPKRGRASISAPGRWSIAFGGLDDRTDAEPLCDLVALWLRHPHGEVPKAARPACLRRKVIGRVPPPALERHSRPGALVPTNQTIRPVPLTGGASPIPPAESRPGPSHRHHKETPSS